MIQHQILQTKSQELYGKHRRITNEILTLSSSLISFIMWQVKELTGGKGANVIMEAVGGKVFTECLKW